MYLYISLCISDMNKEFMIADITKINKYINRKFKVLKDNIIY